MAKEEYTAKFEVPIPRSKRLGDMSPEERAAVIASACRKLKAELEHPAMAKALGVEKITVELHIDEQKCIRCDGTGQIYLVGSSHFSEGRCAAVCDTCHGTGKAAA